MVNPEKCTMLTFSIKRSRFSSTTSFKKIVYLISSNWVVLQLSRTMLTQIRSLPYKFQNCHSQFQTKWDPNLKLFSSCIVERTFSIYIVLIDGPRISSKTEVSKSSPKPLKELQILLMSYAIASRKFKKKSDLTDIFYSSTHFNLHPELIGFFCNTGLVRKYMIVSLF